MNKKLFAQIGNLVKKSGSFGLIAVVVVFGIILLLLPTGESGSDVAELAVVTPDVKPKVTDDLELKIEEALSKLEGAGKVTVVLALQSDGETYLATDRDYSVKSDESREQREETVVINSGSSVQGPVIIKRDYPEYRGALIVSEGADNPVVKLAITQAVMSLTGLSSDRVTVIKMQN